MSKLIAAHIGDMTRTNDESLYHGSKAAKGNSYNFLVVFVVALGSFTYGFSSAILSSVFGLPSFFEYFHLSYSSARSNAIIGAANGLYAGAGLLGALSIPRALNYLGRRRSIQFICVICIVGAAIQGGAVAIAMFLIGRFVNGFGVGMMQVSVPVLQSELAAAKQRGRMVGAHGFLTVTGYSFASFTGLGCYFAHAAVQWRLALSLQCVAPLLLLIASAWLPESPRWLVAQGRDEQGLAILRKLHSDPNDANHSVAADEYHQIHAQIELDKQTKITSLWDMMKRKSYRRRLLCGLLVMFATPFTGVLVLANYEVLQLERLGVTGGPALLLYAIYSTWAAFLNWVNSMLLDRFGRSPLMMIGLAGCATMMAVETAMVAEFAGTENRVGNAMGILFIYLHVSFHAATSDATSYVFCSEIFPTGLRAQGLGVCIAGLFAWTLVVTQVAPTALNTIGWRYYLVFVIVPFLCIPVVYWLIPETKCLTLEEIGAKFGDEIADTAYPGNASLPIGEEPPGDHTLNKEVSSTLIENSA